MLKAKPGRVQILFYFGDGEQTSDKKPKSFSAIRSLVQGGVVMGYGTDQGGPMKENVGYTLDPGEKVDYIKDYTSTDYAGDRTAISKIDEGNSAHHCQRHGFAISASHSARMTQAIS